MLSAGRATQIAMPLLSADEAEADETAGTLSVSEAQLLRLMA